MRDHEIKAGTQIKVKSEELTFVIKSIELRSLDFSCNLDRWTVYLIAIRYDNKNNVDEIGIHYPSFLNWLKDKGDIEVFQS